MKTRHYFSVFGGLCTLALVSDAQPHPHHRDCKIWMLVQRKAPPSDLIG